MATQPSYIKYKLKEIIFLCQTPIIHIKFYGIPPPDNKSYTDEPKREYMKVPLELTESSRTELERCLEEADKSCMLEEAILEESTIILIKNLIWMRSHGYEWDYETEKAAKLTWPHIFF